MGSGAGQYNSRLGKISRMSCDGENHDQVPKQPRLCKYIHDNYGQTMVHRGGRKKKYKHPQESTVDDKLGQSVEFSPNNSDGSGGKQFPSIQENKAEEVFMQFNNLAGDTLSGTFKTEKGVSLAYSG